MGGFGFGPNITTPANSTTYGSRFTFTSTDMTGSGGDAVYIAHTMTSGNWHHSIGDTIAGGGSVRIYFEDSGGNYSGWTVMGGSDWFPFSNYNGLPGNFEIFQVQNNLQSPCFFFRQDTTPDASSGTLDWTDIVAMEVHIRTKSTGSSGAINHLFSVLTSVGAKWTLTNGDVTTPCTFADISVNGAGYGIGGGNGFRRNWSRPFTNVILGSPGTQYAATNGGEIGNGTTATRFDESNFLVTFDPSREAYDDGTISNELQSNPLLLDEPDRGLVIDQSATCFLQWIGATIQGADRDGGEWSLIVQGSTSGTCTWTDCFFRSATSIIVAHATLSGILFDDCEEVEINGDSTVTGSTIRNTASTSKGLYVQTAPADYSAIDVQFAASNLGDDLTINPSAGSGNYNFSSLSTENGHTLTVHNESATVAITVEVAAGVSTSTSTAGGTVTIERPVDLTINVEDDDGNALSNVAVGIYTDDVAATELMNEDTVSGTATQSFNYSTDQDITIRVRESPNTAGGRYFPVFRRGTITASGFSLDITLDIDNIASVT